jgi:Mg2+/citrate symporter
VGCPQWRSQIGLARSEIGIKGGDLIHFFEAIHNAMNNLGTKKQNRRVIYTARVSYLSTLVILLSVAVFKRSPQSVILVSGVAIALVLYFTCLRSRSASSQKVKASKSFLLGGAIFAGGAFYGVMEIIIGSLEKWYVFPLVVPTALGFYYLRKGIQLRQLERNQTVDNSPQIM